MISEDGDRGPVEGRSRELNDTVDHAERYRAALAPFLRELREALSRVPPDVAETGFGATVLASALIDEACRLVRGQIGEAEAQKMLEELVRAHLRDDVGS